nr:ABC transporter permease [uncultured Dyadobacter sp.]
MKPITPQPPKWAGTLLRWFVATHLLDELEGDLYELFTQRVHQYGERQARLRYVKDVFSLMRPSLMRPSLTRPGLMRPSLVKPFAFNGAGHSSGTSSIQYSAMIRNNFKIAFRKLWKHKGFSFINIMGLAVGMSACFVIALYVHFELSYDAFNQKADRIYRLSPDLKTSSETLHYSISSWAFAPAMHNEFEEVEAFTRVATRNYLVRKGDLKFKEEKTVFADSSLFRIFDFKMIRGNPATALREPMSIVFTEKTARKYFGDGDPIGQTLLLGNEGIPATVTGLMKEPPANSQIKGDLFVSMSSYTQHFNKGIDQDWGAFGNTSYLLLKPGTDPDRLVAKLPPFLEKHAGKMMRENQMQITLLMEPLLDIYLHSKRNAEESGNMANVYTFAVIAAFILLIACINFVNLTTARSSERAREVGVRKAVGAARSLLTRQFLSESVLVALVAFAVSVLLSAGVIPLFNDLSGKMISTGILDEWRWVIALFGAALLIGCAAGLYPAFVLSAFDPITVLKGRFFASTKGIMLRKGLVTVQFCISIALIIATMVVYTQVRYMRSREVGFSKDQMLVIQGTADAKRNAFQESLLHIRGVASTAASSRVPGTKNNEAYSEIENARGEMQAGNLETYSVDFDFLKQYDIELAAGRLFSREFGSDSSKALVINEAAVRMLGYATPQEAIGKKYKQWGREGTIIGVVKDFHFKSLQEHITPLTFRYLDWWNGELISVKIEGDDVKAAVAQIEKEWTAQNPDKPFSYYFLDEYFDRQYRADERFEKLFFHFAALAIFISCLGLLGLASYSTVQRTKEIGVRKVMGASAASIVRLLSEDFLKLVALAFVIASPLAWFGMHQWLQSFAYQTEIPWWIFLTAAILSTLIAFITISFQSIRAALMNPVKSLRSE